MHPGWVSQRKFHEGLTLCNFIIKTALLHRHKVGVRLRDYYRTYTEFLKGLLKQKVLFNESLHLHY